MGLEALGNAMEDPILAFPCPSALWLSAVELLVWEAGCAGGSLIPACKLSVPEPKKGVGELQLVHP